MRIVCREQHTHEVTPELIRATFRADGDGRVYWLIAHRNANKIVGKEAGSCHTGRNGKQYWIIQLGPRKLRRSKVVYCLTFGTWPGMLDHEDGNGLNDKPANLRPATRAENARNIKSKKRKSSLPMGVRATTSGKYQARIMEAGRLVSLGSYDTIVAAHRAYISKRVEVFGEFA